MSPPWSRLWRYPVVGVAGLVLWCMLAANLLLPGPLTAAQEDAIGLMLVVDLVWGVAAMAVLPLRRRHPLVIACVTTAIAGVSVSAIGSAAFATVSMATRRRRDWVAVAAVVCVAGGFVARPLVGLDPSVDTVLFGLAFLAAAAATGFYVGARRELLSSLQERLHAAEQEKVLMARVAREAERTSIAREMHDVLAHRISLVAMHAGALAYRDDLDRAQTADTALTIHTNAQLALTELRQVLGVLRSASVEDIAEPPQPTLLELPALLADAREAGSTVSLDTANLPDLRLPDALSRTSFRIVQEALTNARRHAQGEPVGVRLSGSPGGHLDLEVRNPVTHRADPRTGMGLIGLTERAALAGGTLTFGTSPEGDFVVRARLPWPA